MDIELGSCYLTHTSIILDLLRGYFAHDSFTVSDHGMVKLICEKAPHPATLQKMRDVVEITDDALVLLEKKGIRL